MGKSRNSVLWRGVLWFGQREYCSMLSRVLELQSVSLLFARKARSGVVQTKVEGD